MTYTELGKQAASVSLFALSFEINLNMDWISPLIRKNKPYLHPNINFNVVDLNKCFCSVFLSLKLKALFNNIFTLRNLSMSLHATGVFDKVKKMKL